MEENKEQWANLANPPDMIMKLMLLQKKEGFIQAFMVAKRNSVKGANVDSSGTVSWLVALWLECGAVLKRDKPDLWGKIQEGIADRNINLHLSLFNELMDWLDSKGLKWDTRGGYNRRSLEEVTKHLNKRVS